MHHPGVAATAHDVRRPAAHQRDAVGAMRCGLAEQVVADDAIKAFLGNNTVRGRASVEVKAIISALTP